MNYLQFLAFFLYCFIGVITGIAIFSFLGTRDKLHQARFIYLGESLLLGAMFISAQLVVLSLTGLYFGFNLWLVVLLNFLFLLNRDVRYRLKEILARPIKCDLPLVMFIFFVAVFTFRNCFPLMDNDSHSTYMWMPKLWLLNHGSVFGDVTTDLRAFVPHMESVAYGLGMVLFKTDTLFQGLINLSWRWIALILVFGYTSFRFNRYYALAAALMVMLNDHFFYSGINYNVLLNGAIVALLFTGVYNFWESRTQDSSFRFLLALIFLSQTLITKLQMIIAVFLLVVLMLIMQKELFKKIVDILKNKNWVIAGLLALGCVGIWFLKNHLATGLATYPILAGKFNTFGWTPESNRVFMNVMGGIDVFRFLKYMNYIFIWPGVNPAKLIILILSFLPIIYSMILLRSNPDRSTLLEFNFWLAAIILIVMGTTLGSHQDPRYYRYGLGVLAFGCVFSIRFIYQGITGSQKEIIPMIVLLAFSFIPIRVIFWQGSNNLYPTWKENVQVLLNQINTEDLMDKYYPLNKIVFEGYTKNPDKVLTAAWDVRDPVVTSAFMLPERPHVGLWFTAVIKWDSYESEELIVRDLKAHGIEWIMSPRGKNGELWFRTSEEFAKEAVTFERYRDRTYFDYGFPDELTRTNL